MSVLTINHFHRAIADIVAHGDNDVLPFDVDTRFIADCSDTLAELAFEFRAAIEKKATKDCKSTLQALDVFSERLLAPVGPSGFRITTKIHPFWNIYLNALGVAVAERHEELRSPRAHSYRFSTEGTSLFDRSSSWRSFREASVDDCDEQSVTEVVVQTDISSFYEHIYHHRLENFVRDLMPEGANHATQIDVLLGKLAVGRSFGLPVGGQCSRVLSEVLMSSIDRTLTAESVHWRRYVDDFVLIGASQRDAYRALGVLSHAVADFGLSLNRSKTTFLSARHYRDYIEAQLGAADNDTRRLKEIDLHFDPYSDTPEADYDDLKETVEQLDIARLVVIELDKGQPDSFVMVQVSRALGLMEPANAFGICATLLEQKNLHAFRANWSTIMRGIAFIRGDQRHEEIHERLDRILDSVPLHSSHLASIDTNALHYLRTIRFKRTEERAAFVISLYKTSRSITVRRSCIDCWRLWRDRDRFVALRNEWASLSSEEQRMMWLAAPDFGDDGVKFQNQVRKTISKLWKLGIERRSSIVFADTYMDWVSNVT